MISFLYYTKLTRVKEPRTPLLNFWLPVNFYQNVVSKRSLYDLFKIRRCFSVLTLESR